jgi:hypothetical protein
MFRIGMGMMNSAPATPRFGSMLLAAVAGGAIAFGTIPASGTAPTVRVMHGTSRPRSVSASRAILPLPTKGVESRPVPMVEPESTPFGNESLPGGRPATLTPSPVPSDPADTHFVPVEQTFPAPPAGTWDDAPNPEGIDLDLDGEAPSDTTDVLDAETEAQGQIDSSSVGSVSANRLWESPRNEQLELGAQSPSADEEFVFEVDETPMQSEVERPAAMSSVARREDAARTTDASPNETEGTSKTSDSRLMAEESSRPNPVWLALMGVSLGGGLVILAQWAKASRLQGESILQVRIVASDVGMFAAPVSSLPATHATHAPAAADVEPQRGVAVEDFADGGPVLLPLETWDQQQRIRVARLEEVERGMMRKIFEDNEILQRQLVA